MTSTNDSRYVDTSQFASIEQALEAVHPHSMYNDLVPHYFADSEQEPGIPQLVLQAMLARMNGLHQGIHRELVNDNPFGVWPQMRAFFELEVAMLYVTRHPNLITAFASSQSEANRSNLSLPSMQKMLNKVKDEIPAGREAYQQFCDITHPGSLATWSAFNVTSHNADGSIEIEWSSQPRFRDGQRLIAAAQLKQLSDSTVVIFDQLARDVLGDLPASR